MSLLEAARDRQLLLGLPKRGAVPLQALVDLFDQLAALAFAPVEEILRRTMLQSGYRQHLEESRSEDDINRLENVEELITAAWQFDEEYGGCGDLEEFLERVCLVSDTDGWDEQGDKVTLMSLHAAKGLEFPVVYIVAVEDGILPHERNRQDPAGLEEERRLLFVGMTRAREELQLSYAVHREFRGQRRSTIPSSFLMELPRQEMELADATGPIEPLADAPSTHLPRSLIRTNQHSGTGSIITAAQLAGIAPAGPVCVTPDDFHPGMAVTHPEYGPGKILALDGVGNRRRATVTFPVAGEKRFVLAASPLQPARCAHSID
jgi:DNA helicase-2/ATP-dependent DNA helicase PcrA